MGHRLLTAMYAQPTCNALLFYVERRTVSVAILSVRIRRTLCHTLFFPPPHERSQVLLHFRVVVVDRRKQ